MGKATGSAVVFEEPVDGGGGRTGGLGEPLGRAPGGGGERDAGTLGSEDINHGAQDGGFAGAGASGYDAEFRLQCLTEGGGLLGGEFEVCFFLCPFEGGIEFDRRDGGLGLIDAVDGLGYTFFGAGEFGALAGGAKEFLFFIKCLKGIETFFIAEGADALLDERGFNAEELEGLFGDGGMGPEGMTVILKILKGMEDAGINAFFAIGWEAEVERQFVGGFKADTFDVFGEAVGLILKEPFRARAVFFDKTDALTWRDAVSLEKDHEVADRDLFFPCRLDGFGALAPDAGNLAEASGVLADDPKGVGTEVVDNLPGIGFADAVDHSAAEIFANTVNRGGKFGFESTDFELVAVTGMPGPFAGEGERFTALDAGQVAENRNRRPSFGDRDFCDAISVFFVKEDDALQDPANLLFWYARGAHDLGC